MRIRQANLAHIMLDVKDDVVARLCLDSDRVNITSMRQLNYVDFITLKSLHTMRRVGSRNEVCKQLTMMELNLRALISIG